MEQLLKDNQDSEIDAFGKGWDLRNTYAQLPEQLHARVEAARFPEPSVCLFNEAVAASLGLDFSQVSATDLAALLSGQRVPGAAMPIAQAYAGHQFGGFTNLGDGRAILLGEQVTPDGALLDIQYKGSGPTPFSRRGDGLAALGPMLREYVISEAMHALGIPTTRSLAVVTTGQPVYREEPLAGAVLTRVAKSHIRVGTFQYAAALGDLPTLQALADYTIQRHDPDLVEEPDRYLRLLERVTDRQASLVAQWQCVGFVHGVMNTDNVTISGETIDYGPCALMDAYDPKTVFSSIDQYGRYAYGNQPDIMQWNLARFAESLLALIDDDQDAAVEKAVAVLDGYEQRFDGYWLEGMRRKLGITEPEEQDRVLAQSLLNVMAQAGADFTRTFDALTARALQEPAPCNGALPEQVFGEWCRVWADRLDRQPGGLAAAGAVMAGANPVVIPRNHRVQAALDAGAAGDLSGVHGLLKALSRPFDRGLCGSQYTTPPPGDAGRYVTYCGT